MLFFLSACGQTGAFVQDDETALSSVISEGFLLHINPQHVQQTETETAMVEYHTLTHTQTRLIQNVFLNQRHLFFIGSMGRELNAIYVELGQRVQAGDILADLVPLRQSEAEPLFLQRQSAIIELERFERDFNAENDRRIIEILQAEEALFFADDDNWPRLALELSRRELTYEQFLLNNAQTRERLTRQLQNIENIIAGNPIIAPIDGVITFVVNLNPGVRIGGSMQIVTITDMDSFFLSYELPQTDFVLNRQELLTVFRYGDILPMVMSMGEASHEFYAKVVNDPWVTGNRNNIRYLFAPLDVNELFEILEQNEIGAYMMASTTPPARFATQFSNQIENVLALPAAAIRTLNENTYVYIYEQGYRRRQNITIGARCTESPRQFTEIITGLVEGQQVILWR